METLQILGVIGPSLHTALEPQLVELLPSVAACCAHGSRAVQAAAAACALSLVEARPAAVLPTLLRCHAWTSTRCSSGCTATVVVC